MARAIPKFTAVNWFMAALFAVAAALQLNDPDPAAWVTIYAAAALGCVSFGRLPRVWIGHAALAVVAAVWCLLLLSSVSGPVDGAAVFDLGMKMRGDSTELVREVAGLALVAGWAGTLVALGFRAR